MQKTVKYKDIAEAAGVSTAKVCRALSGRADIAPGEIQRIKDLALQMGYTENRLAASIKTGRSRIIGCMINNLLNPFNNEIIAGMEQTATKNDYIVVFMDGSTQAEAKLQKLLSYRMDALILNYTPAESFYEMLDKISETSHIKIVSSEIARNNWSEVVVNFREASTHLVRHLYEYGHRSIGFACGWFADNVINNRLVGYKEGLAQCGLEYRDDFVFIGPEFSDTHEGGLAAGRALISMSERPTAVIAFNDTSAIGIINALNQAGLSVPGDISVCGFDGLDIFKSFMPKLTTIDIRNKKWGSKLVNAAINMIEQEIPVKIKHDWRIFHGGTVQKLL